MSISALIHFMQLISLFTLWKHQKTSGSLMFSECKEREQLHEISYIWWFLETTMNRSGETKKTHKKIRGWNILIIERLSLGSGYNMLNDLTLSWRRSISYKNQSIDLQSKSMDWFVYERDLRHEIVKVYLWGIRNCSIS